MRIRCKGVLKLGNVGLRNVAFLVYVYVKCTTPTNKVDSQPAAGLASGLCLNCRQPDIIVTVYIASSMVIMAMLSSCVHREMGDSLQRFVDVAWRDEQETVVPFGAG